MSSVTNKCGQVRFFIQSQTRDSTIPGHLAYLPKDYQNMGSANPPFHHPAPHQWSAEEEEMKYGPFSDGEADTLKKGP